MKKIIGFLIVIIVIIAVICSYNYFKNKDESNDDLVTVTMAEVAHSIFYYPFYVALENGYFEEEGINLELVLTSGADKVAAAVLSGDVDIGFAGPESAIYVYEGGQEDYLVTFAGLTKRDGQFIVGREYIEDFSYEDLYGMEIVVGRQGGMPALNFLNALKNEGVDVSQITINYSVEFSALSGSYLAGVGDYVNLFEPNATTVESAGEGYVLASIGLSSGEMPYTAYYAQKSYLEENEDILVKFTNAINKGLQFVQENDDETIANIISAQFPDSSIEDLVSAIARYRENDSYLDTPYISEEIFENLESIMIDAGLLDDYVDFDEVVNNLYAE